MFTSRAEYRLLLRQDNADERLMPFALKHGLIEQSLYNERKEVWEKRKKIKEALEEIKIDPETWDAINNRTELKQKTTAAELLKRPQVSIGDVYKASGMDVPERELSVTVEADIKYEGFINKQQKEIGRLKKIEETRIPEDIDYDNIEGLLIESQGKLKKIRPITLGQASRISGVTPADISVLIMYITNNIINVSRETMG
jgi:tRNA uridine 5-carboxymethylaminomethyl modification enzyme